MTADEIVAIWTDPIARAQATDGDPDEHPAGVIELDGRMTVPLPPHED